jgi:hypothetical protein
MMTVIELRLGFAGGPPAGRHTGLVLPAYEIRFDVADDILEDETDDVGWGQLELLIAQTNFDPEDVHYKAAALHQVRQLNRCLAALNRRLHQFHERVVSESGGQDSTKSSRPRSRGRRRALIYLIDDL